MPVVVKVAWLTISLLALLGHASAAAIDPDDNLRAMGRFLTSIFSEVKQEQPLTDHTQVLISDESLTPHDEEPSERSPFQGRYAYATFLSSDDDYVIGASMLGRSITESGSMKGINAHLVVITPTGKLSEDSKTKLRLQGWSVMEVEPIENPNPDKCGRFCDTLTKLRVWGLPFEKVLFLDSDTFVKHNIAHIFDVPLAGSHQISAVSDCGAPTINSGMFLLRPSAKVMRVMLSSIGKIETKGYLTGNSYEYGDQVFIHFFFRSCLNTEECDSNIIPSAIDYNCQLHACDTTRAPRSSCHVLHFSDKPKPWTCSNAKTKEELVELRCTGPPYAEQEVSLWQTKKLWWQI